MVTLNFKIVWAFFVWTGALLTILQWSNEGLSPAHWTAWVVFGVFLAGFLVWTTLRVLIARKFARAAYSLRRK